jgi:predicted ribosomally synthesized peptide with SipW-like signal peptide
MVVLIGTTFAWFSDNVTIGMNKIQAGSYYIETTVIDSAENIIESQADGSYEIKANETYTVTITGKGDATGYCQVTIGDITYYTTSIDSGSSITFEFEMTEDCTANFSAHWGVYSGEVDIYDRTVIL